MPWIEEDKQSEQENKWIEKWIVITPDMAKEWLGRNVTNRRTSERHVKMLAADMKAGRWQRSHQGIRINRKNEIVDGQHRLLAIIEAGVPIEMHVTFTDTDETALHMMIDVGMKRSDAVVIGKNISIVSIAKRILTLSDDKKSLSAAANYAKSSGFDMASTEKVIADVEACDQIYGVVGMSKVMRHPIPGTVLRTALMDKESERPALVALAALKGQGRPGTPVLRSIDSDYVNRMGAFADRGASRLDGDRLILSYDYFTAAPERVILRVIGDGEKRDAKIAEIRQWIKRIWKIE